MLRTTSTFIAALANLVGAGFCQQLDDQLSTSFGLNGTSIDLVLDYDTAAALVSLPLECYSREFQYKDQVVLNGTQDLKLPKDNHPIFYGCFDWHSSVHGHWLMAALLARYPDSELARSVKAVFDKQFEPRKVKKELDFLEQQKSFERTYGWAWFLKLHLELLKLTAINPKWAENTQPLADFFVKAFKDFLPKLYTPVRSGEHPNTAFGMIFAHEYGKYVGDRELVATIEEVGNQLYGGDRHCPIEWEPSGTDFLSPCLQEAELLARLDGDDYIERLKKFIPQLFDPDFSLAPGQVSDNTDGKLVHLHGLNFSRAWNLYYLVARLAEHEAAADLRERMLKAADDHVKASINEVVESHYMGSHWLGTFLAYSLQSREAATTIDGTVPGFAR